MPVTATGLAAKVAVDVRTVLSRSATLQAMCGVTSGDAAAKAAALAALLFIDDAGEGMPAPYGLIMCRPQPKRQIAADLWVHSFDITVEVWIPKPTDAADAEEDFIASHNLDEVCTEVREMADAGELEWELVGMSTGEPRRDEETGSGAGEIGNLLTMTLDAYDE